MLAKKDKKVGLLIFLGIISSKILNPFTKLSVYHSSEFKVNVKKIRAIMHEIDLSEMRIIINKD